MKDSEILDRMPPCAIEEEKKFLGCMLVEPFHLNEASGLIRPEHFYVQAHQILYDTLLKMCAMGEPIEASLLLGRMRMDGSLDKIGGPASIAECLESVVITAYWRAYAAPVRATYQRRQLVRATTEALRDAYDDTIPLEQSLSNLEQSVIGISVGAEDTEPITMFDAVVAACRRVDAIFKRKQSFGLPIGMPAIDKMIGGVFPEELTIVAARPSQGKSSIILQWAYYIASRGTVVYYATLEMGSTEIALKQLCTSSGVSSQKVRNGTIDATDVQQISSVASQVAIQNLYLHDWADIRPFDIIRSARRVKAEVIFVDYLQIVTPPDQKKKRYEQVGDITRQLKLAARKLKVPVVAACQVGRAAEGNDQAPPKLSHLRESGNIEQDADCVMLIHNPKGGIKGQYWDAELLVAKQRNGQTGRFKMNWKAELTLFTALEDSAGSPGRFSEFDEFSQ